MMNDLDPWLKRGQMSPKQMFGHTGRLIRVTRRAPCPICEHPDWCSISDDGAIAINYAKGDCRALADRGISHRAV